MNNLSAQNIKDIAIRLCEGASTQTDVEFDKNKLDNLIFLYETLIKELRSKMRTDDILDRHKISAIITVSFIHNSPLRAIGNNPSAFARNVNYIIALKISTAILAAFNNNKDFQVTKEYTKEFIRLLQNNASNLNFIASSEGKNNIEAIFFLSHIYYFIEKCEQRT